MLPTPVLFLGFNRPATTKKVWDAICRARPARLYVALDGPRASHPEDAEKCAQVAAIVAKVNWPCEVHSLVRNSNLGCKRAVSEGIDWFFANEAEGIILEDDCVPSDSFFRYCEELLDRHRDDERVMSICGSTTMPDSLATLSYQFSRHCRVWGWATWRRAWRYYDVDMTAWPAFRDSGQLRAWSGGERQFERFWTRVMNGTFAGKVDTWDYQWMFACWANGGISCRPSINMISNIGFGPDATHTLGAASFQANAPAFDIPFPLVHPEHVLRHVELDRAIQKLQFNWPVSRVGRVFWKARRYFFAFAVFARDKIRAHGGSAATRAGTISSDPEPNMHASPGRPYRRPDRQTAVRCDQEG